MLKNIKIEKLIELEKQDEQYKALKFLKENLKDDIKFLRLVIKNALISYQLSGKGEAYWWEFAKYFSKNPDKGIIDFLKNSKNNKRLHKIKIKRIKRISEFLDELKIRDFEKYYKNMERFRDEIARVLKTKKDSKTILFSIKMFSYAMRILGFKLILFPMSLNIPLDSRVEKFCKTYEIDYEELNEILRKNNIPPLHFDVFIWYYWNNFLK